MTSAQPQHFTPWAESDVLVSKSNRVLGLEEAAGVPNPAHAASSPAQPPARAIRHAGARSDAGDRTTPGP